MTNDEGNLELSGRSAKRCSYDLGEDKLSTAFLNSIRFFSTSWIWVARAVTMEVSWRVKVASWAEESTQMIWPWVQVSIGRPSTVVLFIMVESHPAAGHFMGIL